MHASTGYREIERHIHWYQEDRDIPITVEQKTVDDASQMQTDGALLALEQRNRRIRMRIQPEIWMHDGHTWKYVRIKGEQARITLPNGEQTHALLAMLRRILAQLDGAMLDVSPK